MLDSLLYVFIGAMLGWQFPQPAWAKFVQAQIVAAFTKKS